MNRFAAFFSALFLSAPLLAQSLLGGGPAAKQPLVHLEVLASHSDGQLTGVVRARIEEKWHVNSHTPNNTFSIPTELTIEAPGVTDISVQYPAHIEREFGFASGKLAVYEGTIEMPFRGRLTGAPPSSVTAKLYYQACDDAVCLPPYTVTASGVLGAGGAVAPGANFTPLSEAPPAGSLWSGDIGSTFRSRGLGLTLLVIFVAGLALNLTPCVYPLIPITLAFFSSQSDGRRGQKVVLSLSYVIGIAITYSTLGVIAALSGRLFGNWLQHPAVLIGFAVMMAVLATSMFGLWDIRLPHALTDRTGARGGAFGALTMGLLVGIVAAPCVGPFVISLIALVSQAGDPALGFLLFFFLALGLGLPYLLLGIFSSAIASLPRSGVWMEHVKKAMGFVLIAMAFYFLRPLTGDVIYRGGVALSLLTGAVFLFVSGFRKKGPASGSEVRLAIAFLLLAGGIFFAIPPRHGEGITWEKYSVEKLAAARAAGKPVIIDFYADWCLPCKELDEKTFVDENVLAESQRFVRLKGDLTRGDDPAAQALSKEYGIVGVPTIVFISPDGSERKDQRLTGFEQPEKFLARMQAVK